MKTPTPFELAQLAAMLNPSARNYTDQSSAVEAAYNLWASAVDKIDYLSRTESEKRNCERQLKELIEGIFTIPPDEWKARIKAYPGRESEIANALWKFKLSHEDLQKQLFRDSSLSKATRTKFFFALPAFAKDHGIPWNDMLLQNQNGVDGMKTLIGMDPVDGNLCRWLYEVRWHQIRENKKREFVPSKNGHHENSIQYKKTFKG